MTGSETNSLPSRHVCEQSPALLPVSKLVTVKLPQPVETCIIKQVLLPRVKCQQVGQSSPPLSYESLPLSLPRQVTERRCSMAASTLPAPDVKMDKCSVEVEVEDQQCTELILQLPRQVCPARINKTYSG